MVRSPCAFRVLAYLAVFGTAGMPFASALAEPPAFPVWAGELARALCQAGRPSGRELSAFAAAAGLKVSGSETTVDDETVLALQAALAGGGEITVTVRLPQSANQRLRIVATPGRDGEGESVFVQTSPDCAINLARVVEHDGKGRPLRLVSYAGDPPAPVDEEALNPPVPPGTDPGGVAVVNIDTGVAYDLPLFAGRLARDPSGEILGRDFHDDDERPFDLDPSRPPVFPIRHGTAVASILLREAPDARLIPLRYPAGSPKNFAQMVAYAASTPARIVSMALGGPEKADWVPFAEEARRHPGLLFVVSAGNNGRDIDTDPIYPSAFRLANVMTVTSTDAFGRLAAESNWGESSVDIAVPGERIEVIDHRGARGRASGSSYAVPRVAALAARLAARHPEWNATDLKRAILDLAVPLEDPGRPIAAGWIPNPGIE